MNPGNIQQIFARALQRHHAGQLAEAETLYRQILGAEPNHADARQFLGVIAHQTGRHDLAVEWIRQAITLVPNQPGAYSNLGEAYRALGRLDEAITAFRRALELKPGAADVYNNLGNALRDGGRLEEAVAMFHRAIELNPHQIETYNNLGATLAEQGLLDEAAALLQRAVQLKPDYLEAWSNLGSALRKRGRLEEAVAAYQRVLQLHPGHCETYNDLGIALAGQGRLDEAIAVYQRAIQLQPGDAKPHGNLGLILAMQSRFDEAVAAYRRALEMEPDYAEVRNNLGNALRDQGLLDEAVAVYRRAIDLQPERASVWSNLIYALHFHPGVDEKTIAIEQERWNRQFAEPLQRSVVSYPNDRDSERRLRIGYVSPEFRDHVTGRYLVPLFQHHDPQKFEILCYAGVVKLDERTREFRERATQWRNTVGLGDEALAALIREDRVDILVDLTQHLAGNRLPVFVREPAPVQVSFAGYPESTGLEAMANRISDRYLESEIGDSRSQIGVDRPSPNFDLRPAEGVFLLETFWCYDPCGAGREVNGLPARQSGWVTFGCLNNFCKINEPVLKLWARVLGQVKEARLLLLCAAGSHRQRTLDLLVREGVAAHRVEFVEPHPRKAYLELYHRMDIALDPFPYNGHTTSLDALWMGVPVISLVGQRAVARAGYSQMSNLGLPELLAYTEDDYVAIASRLAGDLPRLAELRATLRSRMEASPLMDAPRFTLQIESAYRSMWRRWCAEKPLEHL